MSDQLVTQADYARHRGVTRQMVGKWIAADKIELVERGGKKLIDKAAADLALGANVERILAGDDQVEDDDGPGEAAVAPVEKAPGLTAARTEREQYMARLAELDLNQRLGKLRPVEDVVAAAQLCAEAMIRVIGRIRGRADELVARVQKDSVFGARQALREIERDLRQAAAAEFAKLAAGELPAGAVEDEDEDEAAE